VAVASAGLYASLHLIPDNHTNIPPLSFLQAGCPSCCPDALPAAQMPFLPHSYTTNLKKTKHKYVQE